MNCFYCSYGFGFSLKLFILNGKVDARISMSGKKDKNIISISNAKMILEVMDTNLDSHTDSLIRRRLEFQNLNNNGDNLLTKEETKLEDIILASTHGENIIYEIRSRISSEIIRVGFLIESIVVLLNANDHRIKEMLLVKLIIRKHDLVVKR
ncbi:hypothetical protein M9H77_23235 [Catharanthus roseus]|uniref:Uncharacterized protein n=1 Tax=Catharanthus roseus TaxID=4058 RepID=A0ACC0ASC3_CATRO|nr:hypothetical protein M9H77_23235 [Catharanthus roseus]